MKGLLSTHRDVLKRVPVGETVEFRRKPNGDCRYCYKGSEFYHAAMKALVRKGYFKRINGPREFAETDNPFLCKEEGMPLAYRRVK